MRCWPNVGLLLAHILRRWSNSELTFGQRLMFAGLRLRNRLGLIISFPLSLFCFLEDSCTDSPCLNGECYPSSTGYECMCFSGYTGKTCDTRKSIFLLNKLRYASIIYNILIYG